jgi:hypothetical protein
MYQERWQRIGWGALILAGLVVLAMAWKALLLAVVLFIVVGSTLAIVIGVPTFLISLCLEWSLTKAWERAKSVAIGCFYVVGEFLSHAV